MFQGFFRPVIVFIVMFLVISGGVYGGGLNRNLSVNPRTNTGSSWGLGGLSGSSGLLNKSLQYNSDMNRTGIGANAGGSSSSYRPVGGMSGNYYRRPSGSSTGIGSPTTSGGANNTSYNPMKIGDLDPVNLGKYKGGTDYANMIKSLKQDATTSNVGEYKFTAGDTNWDRADTLQSQLTTGKKYGMKSDVSIARSDAYMQALAASGYIKDEDEKAGIAQDSSRITTLVPRNGGEFSELIKRGEDAFKQELYQEALSLFKLARRISPRSPEVLLSLFHTSFAASSGLSYSLPAYYLQQSLQYFPELPLVDVHPKYFYAREGDFTRDQVRLENYIEDQPRDPQALFLMGYIKWRNGDTAAACKNLQAAYDMSQDSELKEAISIMWDGMVASGAVKEKLVTSISRDDKTPTTAPADK